MKMEETNIEFLDLIAEETNDGSFDDSNEFIDISQLGTKFILSDESEEPTDEVQTYMRPLKCKKCDKRCSNEYGLKIHEKTYHPSTQDHKPKNDLQPSKSSTLNCALCDAPFTDRVAFKAHIRMHYKKLKLNEPTPKFNCTECTFTTNELQLLKIHERVHTGVKKFQCTVCKETFVNNEVLKAHKITHVGSISASHQCKICGQTFTRGYSLKVHEIVHTGEKPFACNVCRQEFNREWNLKVHMKIHSGDRPFKCRVCSKAFTIRGYLRKHELSHTNRIKF